MSTIGNFEKKNECHFRSRLPWAKKKKTSINSQLAKAHPLHSIVWLLFELLLASGREQHILKSISGFRI